MCRKTARRAPPRTDKALEIILVKEKKKKCFELCKFVLRPVRGGRDPEPDPVTDDSFSSLVT